MGFTVGRSTTRHLANLAKFKNDTLQLWRYISAFGGVTMNPSQNQADLQCFTAAHFRNRSVTGSTIA
jgi:hypothetical protein